MPGLICWYVWHWSCLYKPDKNLCSQSVFCNLSCSRWMDKHSSGIITTLPSFALLFVSSSNKSCLIFISIISSQSWNKKTEHISESVYFLNYVLMLYTYLSCVSTVLFSLCLSSQLMECCVNALVTSFKETILAECPGMIKRNETESEYGRTAPTKGSASSGLHQEIALTKPSCPASERLYNVHVCCHVSSWISVWWYS